MDLQTLIHEIRIGDYLSGDHMNRFADILRMTTQFSPQNVFFIGALEFVQALPVHRKHIQLLSDNLTHVDSITHWICIFYDGLTINVYDSLNRSTLSPTQFDFLHRMFPHHPPVVFRRTQRQPNSVDCGVFALAFASSLAIGIDPAGEEYCHQKMREHLASIFETNVIHRFPLSRESNVLGHLPVPEIQQQTSSHQSCNASDVNSPHVKSTRKRRISQENINERRVSTRLKEKDCRDQVEPSATSPKKRAGRPPKAKRRINKTCQIEANADNAEPMQISDIEINTEIIDEEATAEHYCGPVSYTHLTLPTKRIV